MKKRLNKIKISGKQYGLSDKKVLSWLEYKKGKMNEPFRVLDTYYFSDGGILVTDIMYDSVHTIKESDMLQEYKTNVVELNKRDDELFIVEEDKNFPKLFNINSKVVKEKIEKEITTGMLELKNGRFIEKKTSYSINNILKNI